MYFHMSHQHVFLRTPVPAKLHCSRFIQIKQKARS